MLFKSLSFFQILLYTTLYAAPQLKSSTNQLWEFDLRSFQFCGLFVDCLWTVCGLLMFPRSVNSLHYVFSLSTHLQTIALSILFSSNAFWIMSKVSALYLEGFRPEFLCLEYLKSSLFPWLVLKIFLCCESQLI